MTIVARKDRNFASLRGGTTKQSVATENKMKRVGHTYILSNANNTTLYVGVAADLVKRMEEHINKIHPNSFSAKYNLTKLVWFDSFNHIEEAIAREKQLKAGSRKRKEELINSINPSWIDLYPKIISGEIEV